MKFQKKKKIEMAEIRAVVACGQRSQEGNTVDVHEETFQGDFGGDYKTLYH